MSALEAVAQIVEAESYAALSAPAQHAANDFQHLGNSQRACAEVPASSRSRDEFLAMLGHELRNSAGAVRNAVFCAQLDSRQSERALDIAWRQTERLNQLVEDLLDVTRIAQGCFRLNRQRVALMEIITHAVEATRFLVEDRGHTLTVSPPADRVRVDGDPLRLEQIVVNLVSNAAKYTEPGGCIELLVERHGAEAVVRVRDNGIGISLDLLLRIFDLFVQEERALEHARAGARHRARGGAKPRRAARRSGRGPQRGAREGIGVRRASARRPDGGLKSRCVLAGADGRTVPQSCGTAREQPALPARYLSNSTSHSARVAVNHQVTTRGEPDHVQHQ